MIKRVMNSFQYYHIKMKLSPEFWLSGSFSHWTPNFSLLHELIKSQEHSFARLESQETVFLVFFKAIFLEMCNPSMNEL
jgi:hypothetical protein